MVVQFVAFLGAYRDPGGLDPWVAGVLGSLLTVWVTFVPCFVFIFLGAPYVERLRGSASLSAALTGVTAAVVGVIANLALYFAVHTLFAETRTARRGPGRAAGAGVVVVRLGGVRPDALWRRCWSSCSSGRCCARSASARSPACWSTCSDRRSRRECALVQSC